MKLVRDMAAKYRPDMELTLEYAFCVRNSMTLAEAIRVALDKVGYDGLTSESVLNAFEEIKDFKNMDLGCPQSFGDYYGDRVGPTAYRMWGWDAGVGKVKILSDWIPAVDLPDLGYLE